MPPALHGYCVYSMVKTAGMAPSRKKKTKKTSKAQPPANGNVESMPAIAKHAQPTRQLLSLPQLSQYFNSLVQLVPPRFYFDTAGELLDLKHMKKRDKEIAKAAIKTKGKVRGAVMVACVHRNTPLTGQQACQAQPRSSTNHTRCAKAARTAAGAATQSVYQR